MTLCVFALTAMLAVSPDQTVSQAPNGSADNGRVVRKLPPVNFGTAQTPAPARRDPAAGPPARRRAELLLRALQTQRGQIPASNVKTVCGMTVIQQSPDLDEKILMPPDRSDGAAVRRIE